MKVNIDTESNDPIVAKVAQLITKYTEEKENLIDCEAMLLSLTNSINSYLANEWGVSETLSSQIDHHCNELKSLLKDTQQQVSKKQREVSTKYSEEIKKLNL